MRQAAGERTQRIAQAGFQAHAERRAGRRAFRELRQSCKHRFHFAPGDGDEGGAQAVVAQEADVAAVAVARDDGFAELEREALDARRPAAAVQREGEHVLDVDPDAGHIRRTV